GAAHCTARGSGDGHRAGCALPGERGRALLDRPGPLRGRRRAPRIVRPETLSRVENREASVWRSADGAKAVPRPAKAGAANVETLGSHHAPRCGHVVSSQALTLLNVCRAGRPRHAVGPLPAGGTLAVRPRPETKSRVGLDITLRRRVLCDAK